MTPPARDATHSPTSSVGSDSSHQHDLDQATFDRLNTRLLGIGYRMLGSWADAEDVAAETWLRWHTARPTELVSPEAWLTTVASRLSLDRWRVIARRREIYPGPWLPEPIDADLLPHETVEQADTLAYGLLRVLDRLGPDERIVYVLRHAFGYRYDDIAEMLGRSAASCRQLNRRAQSKLDRAGDPRPSAERAAIEQLVAAISAARIDEAVSLLSDESVLFSDGGGKVPSALRPILGPDKIVRFLLGISGGLAGAQLTFRALNSHTALVISWQDGKRVVFVELDQSDKVHAICLLGNPDKLSRTSA